MGGTIIAFGLLATLGMTAYSLIRHRSDFNIAWWIFILLLWGIVVQVMLPQFTLPNGRGSSTQSLMISSLCFVLSAAIVTPNWRRYWILLCFTFAMMIALPWYAASLLAVNDYSSHRHTMHHMRDSLFYELREIEKHNGWSYPAGWLADQPFTKEIDHKILQGHRVIPHPLWHSWLTRLYRKETIPGEAWYPGGKIKDALGKIEYRPR
ncbi:MAG: hypothetical protein ACYC7E_14270 [Armatimonadota bacterium]